MNRVFVLGSIAILLLSFFLLCASQNKRHHALIRKGTTVIFWAEKDSITVACDSRNQIYNSDNTSYFTDTINKIFKAGNFFFVFVGTESLGNTQLRDIVIKNYNPSLSLRKNCDEISTKLAVSAQDFYSSLTQEQKTFFDSHGLNQFQINLNVVGYEKNKPVIGFLKIDVKKDADNYIVSEQVPVYREFPYQLVTAGYDDHIKMALFDSGYKAMLNSNKTSAYKIGDLIQMIALEAKNHQQIDSNVNYVVIKRQSFKWGRNY